LSKKTEGDPNPDLPRIYALQGEVNQSIMRLSAAEQNLRAAFAAAQKLNGDDHVDTIQTGLRLGIFLVDIGKSAEGLQYLERAKDAVLRVRGPDDPFHTPAVLLEYGNALARTGHIEDGLVYIDRAVANRRKNRPGTLYLAQMLGYRASWLIDLGDYEEARKVLDEASAIQGKVDDQSDRLLISTRVKLLVAIGKPEEAASLMAHTYGRWPKTNALSVTRLRVMRDRAAVALEQPGSGGAADIAASVLRELVASPERTNLKNWEADFDLLTGQSLLKRHLPADALPLLTAALNLRSGFLDSISLGIAEVLVPLGECELQLGDPGRARSFALRAGTILAAHAKVGEQYRVPFNRLEAGRRGR
jgi:serine/threonine-protein kinase